MEIHVLLIKILITIYYFLCLCGHVHGTAHAGQSDDIGFGVCSPHSSYVGLGD